MGLAGESRLGKAGHLPGGSGEVAVAPAAPTAFAEDIGLAARHVLHDLAGLCVHVVDVSGSEGRDPVEDFDAINAELKQYSPDLAERPQIVAANKVDILPPDSDNLERLRSHVEALGYTLLEISAAAHQGTRELDVYKRQVPIHGHLVFGQVDFVGDFLKCHGCAPF